MRSRACWEHGTTTRKGKGKHWNFVGHLVCTRGLGYPLLFDPHNSAVKRSCPHITDKETEAKRLQTPGI